MILLRIMKVPTTIIDIPNMDLTESIDPSGMTFDIPPLVVVMSRRGTVEPIPNENIASAPVIMVDTPVDDPNKPEAVDIIMASNKLTSSRQTAPKIIPISTSTRLLFETCSVSLMRRL